MRKFIVVFFILATVLVFAACGEDIKPKTATYTIDGGMDTATFYLNTEEKMWNSTPALYSSYVITGDLKLEGDRITAVRYDVDSSQYVEFKVLSENEIKAVKVTDGFFVDMEPWIKEGDVFTPFADSEEGESQS